MKIKLIFAALLIAFVAGCREYKRPIYEEVDTNETAYLIDLEDTDNQGRFESVEFLNERKIAAKRVEIPRRWKSTGYMWFSGEYIPTQRIIKVSRTPVTRVWSADPDIGNGRNGPPIWAESADSVGFSLPITITAKIDEEDSSRFLYEFKNAISSNDDGKYGSVTSSLAPVMDTNIRSRIQTILAAECAKYDMDELRRRKNEVIQKIRDDVVPFFQEKGITIETLGFAGGFTYENDDIQAAIDRTMEAQQLKVVRKAEYEAQLEENERIKAEAQARADAEILSATGEAEAIRLRADAKAYEVQQLTQNPEAYIMLRRLEVMLATMEKWNGQLPVYSMSTGGSSSTPDLLLNIPSPQTGN